MSPTEVAVWVGIVLGLFGIVGGILRFVEAGANVVAAVRRRFHSELSIRFKRTPTYVKDDYQDLPNGSNFLARRTIRVGVAANGTAAEGLRLQLLRFTPQGRQGPIFMREAFDVPPYERSRVGGYRYDRDSPPILFDICSFVDRRLGNHPIALHYAVETEPNGIRPDKRYYLELQAFAQTGRSKPATFFVEVGNTGQLEFGPGELPR